MHVVDSFLIEKVCRDDLPDDLVHDLLAKLLRRDAVGVLGRNNDGVYTKRNGSTAVLLVLNGDLSLGVGTQPRKNARTTCDRHCSIELMRKHDGQRHVLLRLVGSISKHNTLVTSTNILKASVIKTLGNVGGLLLDRNENIAGLVVKALFGVVVSDLLDGVADDLLVVDDCLGGNLAENHDHASFRRGLAGNFGERVLLKASIKLNAQEKIIRALDR